MTVSWYSSLVVVVVSTLFASHTEAAPAPSTLYRASTRDAFANGAGTFSIPITKRSPRTGLTANENLARLEWGMRKAYNKYGMDYPIYASNSEEVPGVASDRFAKRQGAVQLADVTGDVQYYGSIQVGTPPKQFEVIMDTGSSDLILATAPCNTDTGCVSSTPLYTPSESSTSGTSTTSFDITYGTGSADGSLVHDTVSVGGYTMSNQIFAACDNFTNVVEADMSGLLGLGWQQIATSGAVPLVQALWQAGSLAEPMFGFAFARWITDNDALNTVEPGGFLTIGGVNTTMFSGELNYIDLTSEGYWLIPLQDVQVGGSSLGLSSDNVIIDSGTSLIGAPRSAVEQIYSQIPGSVQASSTYYAFECSQEVTLALTFGGVSYTIDSSDFNNGAADSTGRYCVGAVFILDDGSGGDQWIIGDVFLKNVYSAYRFSPASVGFAPLTASSAVVQSGSVPASNATRVDGATSSSSSSGTRSLKPPGLGKLLPGLGGGVGVIVTIAFMVTIY